MTMTYFFHPKAKDEFISAIDYYEECSPGLGLEFSKEIYSTIQRIICFPILPNAKPPGHIVREVMPISS